MNEGDHTGVVVVERTMRESSRREEVGCNRGLSGDGQTQLDDLVQARTQAQEESEKVHTVAPDLSDGRGPFCTSAGHR